MKPVTETDILLPDLFRLRRMPKMFCLLVLVNLGLGSLSTGFFVSARCYDFRHGEKGQTLIVTVLSLVTDCADEGTVKG